MIGEIGWILGARLSQAPKLSIIRPEGSPILQLHEPNVISSLLTLNEWKLQAPIHSLDQTQFPDPQSPPVFSPLCSSSRDPFDCPLLSTSFTVFIQLDWNSRLYTGARSTRLRRIGNQSMAKVAQRSATFCKLLDWDAEHQQRTNLMWYAVLTIRISFVKHAHGTSISIISRTVHGAG